MVENCAICGCILHRRGQYAKPTIKGRSHATSHHYVAERFFGRSANRPRTVRKRIFEKCPWGLEGRKGVFCYECHEELLHNPVVLSDDVQKFAQLVRLHGFSEEHKTKDRARIAGRIRLFHEVFAVGLDHLLHGDRTSTEGRGNSGSTSESRKELAYVGSAGLRGGTLHDRLRDHLDKGGWQTAFRRKVLERIFSVPEGAKADATYRKHLQDSRQKISEFVRDRCFVTWKAMEDPGHFENWLLLKYRKTLWNKQFPTSSTPLTDHSRTEMEMAMDKAEPIRFRDISWETVPKKTGVYKIYISHS